MMAQYTLTQYVLYVHVQTQKPGYEATYIIITSLTHIAYVLKACMKALANLSKACGIDDGLDVLSLTEVDVVFVDCAARKTHPFFIVVVELQPGERGEGRGEEGGRMRREQEG